MFVLFQIKRILLKNQNAHLPYLISIGLLVSFILSLAGTLFPADSAGQTLLFKLDALFAISAFSCLSAKAASDKFDIASAGFVVLAIAQGLFLSEIDRAGQWNFETASIGILFMIPAVFMISYYLLFPKWLRLGGMISMIPFMILLYIRQFSASENTIILENIVFLIYQTVTICWAWQIWKNRTVDN
jgi:hypothetical protein